MILRPVRPQSPSGPPMTKLPVGLTRKSDGRLRHPALRQRRFDRVGDHLLDQAGRVFLAVAAVRLVLGGHHHLGAADRLAFDVFDGDLALGVGLQIGQLAGVALVGEYLENAVREKDRRRHEGILLVDLALGAGETEHHALVAGAFLLAALFLLGVHAHGDVGRLAVQQHLDVGAVMREAVLVVADVLDHAARDLGDQLAVHHDLRAVLDEERRLPAALAGDHDLVGGGQRLAAEPRVHQTVVGDAELEVVLDEGVEHGVGNLVTHLVGMTFGNGFAGEQEIGVSHRILLRARSRAPLHVGAVSCSGGRRGQDAGCVGGSLAARWDGVSPRPRSARPDRRCGGATCCS